VADHRLLDRTHRGVSGVQRMPISASRFGGFPDARTLHASTSSSIVKSFLFLALLLSVGCHEAPAPVTREVVVWRPLGSWSGHVSSQTGSFPSDTGALRVRWETKNETAPGAGTFVVTLHSAVSGRPLLPAVDHRGVGRDVAYLHEDPRVFYFEVVSANVEWSIDVDEGIQATVTSRPSPPVD
jgi:hypothetical protein